VSETSSASSGSERVQRDLAGVRGLLMDSLTPVLGSLQADRRTALPDEERDLLRPSLLLLTARSLGCAGDRAVRLAAALQMIHLAALLHDRLGGPAAGEGGPDDAGRGRHHRESMDILLGDFLFSKASCIVIEDGEERIVRDMIQTSVASAEVQATLADLAKHPEAYGPARCFDIVSDKTSLLLCLGLRVGAMLGNAGPAQRDGLSAFGASFGRALRVVEDLAWWEGAGTAEGPPPGVRCHHPLLLLWEEEGREAWEEAVRALARPAGRGREAARSRVRDAGYLGRSREHVRRAAGDAVSCLERHPVPEPTAAALHALVRERLLRGDPSLEGAAPCGP